MTAAKTKKQPIDSEIDQLVESESEFDIAGSALAQLTRSPKLRVEATDILNSALFTAVSTSAERKSHLRRKLPLISNSEITITHTGFELSVSDDEDVWLNILYHAQKLQIHEKNFTIKVRTSEFLRAMSWPVTGRSYNKLAQSLSRLDASSIEVMNEPGDKYSFSFIRSYALGRDEPDGLLVIEIEPKVYRFYQKSVTTQINHQIRKSLRSPLAKKVYSLILGGVKFKTIEEMHILTGVNYKHLRQFKAKLNTILNKMIDINVIKSFNINTSGEIFIEHLNDRVISPSVNPAPLD